MPLTLYKNLIILPDLEKVDLLTDGKTILALGGEAHIEEVTIVDCAGGAFISPGFVDLRARSGEPGQEENETWESLAIAARAGGFTHLHILPDLSPCVDNASMVATVQKASRSGITFNAIGSITKGKEPQQLANMLEMGQAGAKFFGIAGSVSNSDILLKALQYGSMTGAVIIDQPTDYSTSLYGQVHESFESNLLGLKGIPSLSEYLAVQRNIEILRYAGGRLHLSCLSTKESVTAVQKAKAEGLAITCDVAAHQLVFDNTVVSNFDTNFKVMPPFRSPEDIEALIAGLVDGTIDAIVSDHTPVNIDGKQLEFDQAQFGVSTLPIVFSMSVKALGKDPQKLSNWLAINPRKLAKLPIAKVEVGSRDFTIFSLEQNTLFTKETWPSLSGNQPLIGTILPGKILGIIS